MKTSLGRIIKAGGAAILVSILLQTGCRNAAIRPESNNHSTIPVTIASVRTGQMVTYAELNATSAYMFKSEVKSPVTGFIDKMTINQGDAIQKNQLLFKIRTREATAILRDSSNNMKFSGVIDVNAATDGIISSIVHSTGDYVSESDLLCQIAIKSSYVFILDVPFELSRIVKINTPCTIILPDSQSVAGIIRSKLPLMTGNSQTERYIVRLNEPKNLPENLTGRIRIVKESVKEAVILPKSSILTNETMQDFWVMKLINDSMAVKVPVITGISTANDVQITSPAFKASDLFLTSGNYGLGDTVYVMVLK